MLATWGCTTFPKPTLSLDFLGATSLDSGITFSRASTATFFNSLGVLTTASSGVARFDYNPSTLQPRGLLIEEQRTNSIRNNTMQGAVAGTPGTLPTNWAEVGGGLGTLTRQIVGTGTENGITYIDLKFSGTTSTVSVGYAFEAVGGIAASNGQTWTNSFWCKLVAGSAANITSVNSLIEERTGAGGFLANTVSAISPTATLTRFPQTFTLNAGATVGQVRGGFILLFSSGVAIDITLRIGLPQLELGAFATSVIPTTTTALTRNADVASMTGTNFSSWFNAAGIGTLFAQAASRSTSTANALITQIDSGSSADIFGIYHQVDEQAVFRVRIGNVNIFGTGFGTLTDGVVAKTAAAFQSGSNAACLNGGTVVSNTTSFSAPTMSVLRIGTNQISTESINGWVQRLAYYPVRLQASQLQALTA